MKNSSSLKSFFGLITVMYILTSCQESSPNNNSYFQGEVHYTYSYESENLDADSISKNRPHTGVFRFDLDNYQSTFLGKTIEQYYYSSKYNTCLNEYNEDGVFTCEDYSIATDSVLNFKIYDSEEKVFGQECLILEFQGKYFWNTFYVSKELKISPKTYKDHKAYNWKFYGETSSGGLVLKVEHHFKNFVMKGVITRIKHFDDGEKALSISDDLFKSYCK